MIDLDHDRKVGGRVEGLVNGGDRSRIYFYAIGELVNRVVNPCLASGLVPDKRARLLVFDFHS